MSGLLPPTQSGRSSVRNITRRRVIALMLSGAVVLGVGGWLWAEGGAGVEPAHQVTRYLDCAQAPGPVPEPQEPPGGSS